MQGSVSWHVHTNTGHSGIILCLWKLYRVHATITTLQKPVKTVFTTHLTKLFSWLTFIG